MLIDIPGSGRSKTKWQEGNLQGKPVVVAIIVQIIITLLYVPKIPVVPRKVPNGQLLCLPVLQYCKHIYCIFFVETLSKRLTSKIIKNFGSVVTKFSTRLPNDDNGMKMEDYQDYKLKTN